MPKPSHAESSPMKLADHKVTSTDEMVRGYHGTVARCTCGWISSWSIQDGSAEADGAAHEKYWEARRA